MLAVGQDLAVGGLGKVHGELKIGLHPVRLKLTASRHNGAGTPPTRMRRVATFGLVVTILAGVRFRLREIPALVGAYIVAAYWFTASTSFANPAVTIARAPTDIFSGMRMIDVPAFIAAQLAGALLALGLCRWLLPKERPE